MDIDKLGVGRELNALVSDKIFDKPFRKPTHGPCCTCQVCGYNNDWDCQCGWSESIDRAWEVLLRLRELGFSYSVYAIGGQIGAGCNLWGGPKDNYWGYFGNQGLFINAPTAELAICRAALTVMTQSTADEGE